MTWNDYTLKSEGHYHTCRMMAHIGSWCQQTNINKILSKCGCKDKILLVNNEAWKILHNHKEMAHRKLKFHKCYYNRHDNDITKLAKLIFGFCILFCQNLYCSSITYTTFIYLYVNEYWLFIFLQTLTCFNQLTIIIRRPPFLQIQAN
jgi:hypothetical protein